MIRGLPLEHKKVLHLMRCSLASLECFIKGKADRVKGGVGEKIKAMVAF